MCVCVLDFIMKYSENESQKYTFFLMTVAFDAVTACPNYLIVNYFLHYL